MKKQLMEKINVETDMKKKMELYEKYRNLESDNTPQ